MHNAPSVIFPLGRSHFAGALLLLTWLLGALATGAGWAQGPAPGWRWVAGGSVLVGVGLLAALGWRRHAPGTLAWDGQVWNWSESGSDAGSDAGELQVNLDFQRWMLVRWSGENKSTWLWLERAHCVERWDDLRRAVYSRGGLQALPRAEPSAAKT